MRFPFYLKSWFPVVTILLLLGSAVLFAKLETPSKSRIDSIALTHRNLYSNTPNRWTDAPVATKQTHMTLKMTLMMTFFELQIARR